MTERERVLLVEFKSRLDKLIDVYLRTKREKEHLLEEQLRLKEQIRVVNLQNEELIKKIDELKFAGSLSGQHDDNHDAKLKINKLVREIDKCIAMLNK